MFKTFRIQNPGSQQSTEFKKKKIKNTEYRIKKNFMNVTDYLHLHIINQWRIEQKRVKGDTLL